MLKTEITSKTGFGVRDDVYFKAESMQPISEDQALKAQMELGYHPAGYGFYNFTVKRCPVLFVYTATWRCQASCD